MKRELLWLTALAAGCGSPMGTNGDAATADGASDAMMVSSDRVEPVESSVRDEGAPLDAFTDGFADAAPDVIDAAEGAVVDGAADAAPDAAPDVLDAMVLDGGDATVDVRDAGDDVERDAVTDARPADAAAEREVFDVPEDSTGTPDHPVIAAGADGWVYVAFASKNGAGWGARVAAFDPVAQRFRDPVQVGDNGASETAALIVGPEGRVHFVHGATQRAVVYRYSDDHGATWTMGTTLARLDIGASIAGALDAMGALHVVYSEFTGSSVTGGRAHHVVLRGSTVVSDRIFRAGSAERQLCRAAQIVTGLAPLIACAPDGSAGSLVVYVNEGSAYRALATFAPDAMGTPQFDRRMGHMMLSASAMPVLTLTRSRFVSGASYDVSLVRAEANADMSVRETVLGTRRTATESYLAAAIDGRGGLVTLTSDYNPTEPGGQTQLAMYTGAGVAPVALLPNAGGGSIDAVFARERLWVAFTEPLTGSTRRLRVLRAALP